MTETMRERANRIAAITVAGNPAPDGNHWWACNLAGKAAYAALVEESDRMNGTPCAEQEREELVGALVEGECWLTAALECPTWAWDFDQREAATMSRDNMRTLLAKYGAPHD